MDKITLPNILSLSRVVLAIPSLIFVLYQWWYFAAAIVLVAVATDLLDGYFARGRDEVSSLGGTLDHGSDALFVTVTLTGLALIDLVPLLLPALVVLAFTQYLLDSKALKGMPLRASRLGRYNGIAYFVLAGLPSMQHSLDIYLLDNNGLMIAGWILVASTLISMTDRLVALLRR